MGRYSAADGVLAALEATGRVVLRYADADGSVTPDANPNGSLRSIAGIVNERGNVLGLMPHPERAAEAEVGGTDGFRILRGLDAWLAMQPAAAERRPADHPAMIRGLRSGPDGGPSPDAG